MDFPLEFAGLPAEAGEGAGVAQEGAPGITFGPTGEPMPQIAEQQPAETEQRQGVDLTQLEEFRRYQSQVDRQRAEMERQIAELKAQQAEYQTQQRQAEYEYRLQNARTPQERDAIQRERFDQERAEIQAQRVAIQDEQNLRAWDDVYVQQYGVPPQALQAINQIASQGAQDAADFHTRRDYLVNIFRATAQARAQQGQQPGAAPQHQQAPQQPQQPQGYRQQPAAQPVAQPVARPGGAPGVTNLNQMLSTAMSDGSNESWAKLYRQLGMSNY
jgi:hypothetical protein